MPERSTTDSETLKQLLELANGELAQARWSNAEEILRIAVGLSPEQPSAGTVEALLCSIRHETAGPTGCGKLSVGRLSVELSKVEARLRKQGHDRHAQVLQRIVTGLQSKVRATGRPKVLTERDKKLLGWIHRYVVMTRGALVTLLSEPETTVHNVLWSLYQNGRYIENHALCGKKTYWRLGETGASALGVDLPNVTPNSRYDHFGLLEFRRVSR